MCDHTDTKELDYRKHQPEPRRYLWWQRLIMSQWLWITLSLLLVTTFSLAFYDALKAKRERRNNAGTMTAKYTGDAKAVLAKDGVPVLSRPLNRIIFRLDGVEIFRFTYEGGRDGQNFSFEVVEGSQ